MSAQNLSAENLPATKRIGGQYILAAKRIDDKSLLATKRGWLAAMAAKLKAAPNKDRRRTPATGPWQTPATGPWRTTWRALFAHQHGGQHCCGGWLIEDICYYIVSTSNVMYIVNSSVYANCQHCLAVQGAEDWNRAKMRGFCFVKMVKPRYFSMKLSRSLSDKENRT